MEYTVDSKRIRYNPYNMKKDLKLNEGLEVVAYKLKNNKVVKFYKPYCTKRRMTKEFVFYTTDISTKRILLPQKALLDKKRRLSGYIMDYVLDRGRDSLLVLEKDKLKNELMLLRDDLILLSDNKVLIDDLNIKNTCFNEGIYFIDPGSYIMSNYDKVYTYANNQELINEYFCDVLLFSYLYKLDSVNFFDAFAGIRKEFCSSKYENYLEFIFSNIREDNLGEYLKTKIKKR